MSSGIFKRHTFRKSLLPQAPPLAAEDLTSTVTAGNIPIVMVKTKHTERAITQIYRSRGTKINSMSHLGHQERLVRGCLGDWTYNHSYLII